MPVTAFLTDSSLCIGCKACEVACKEWNDVPADGYTWTGFSYDHTGALGHSTWRHVKFIESRGPGSEVPSPRSKIQGQGDRSADRGRATLDLRPRALDPGPVWEFASDVCKHCERAGCLEACPTGAIVRTEFGGVFIQPDVCNGCGYCVVTCPFGVVERRPDDGRAFKCTFCYDRQKAGLIPACAKACPTESILFGEIDDLRVKAVARASELRARGVDAHLYDARDTSVGGTHAMFIVQQDPRALNLPPAPEVPTVHLRAGWSSAAIAAGFMLASAALAFLSSPRGEASGISSRSGS
jgi:formate dehydrogenase iron-sulfur subunit